MALLAHRIHHLAPPVHASCSLQLLYFIHFHGAGNSMCHAQRILCRIIDCQTMMHQNSLDANMCDTVQSYAGARLMVLLFGPSGLSHEDHESRDDPECKAMICPCRRACDARNAKHEHMCCTSSRPYNHDGRRAMSECLLVQIPCWY